MIPRTSWRDRVRLAWAILRGQAYVDDVRSLGWGQIIRLRTFDDVKLVRGDS